MTSSIVRRSTLGSPRVFTKELLAALAVCVTYAFVIIATGGSLPLVAFAASVVLGVAVTTEMLARRFSDRRIRTLAFMFDINMLLLLGLMQFGWLRELNPAAPGFGSDSQRFFFNAADLASRSFDRSVLPPTNYAGIFYVYGAIFAVLGTHPIGPSSKVTSIPDEC